MFVQHPLILAVVTSFVLGNQLVASTSTNCGGTDYTDYIFDDKKCHISYLYKDEESEGKRHFCHEPPAPELKPYDDVPKMFKIGVPFDLSETLYCGRTVVSYSPYASIFSRNAEKVNTEAGTAWLMQQNTIYNALSSVTHVKANFYIKSRTGTWDPKGQFGPFYYRYTQDEQNSREFEYLEMPYIQGFESYDDQNKIAYFRFFLTSNMKLDSTIQSWLTQPQHYGKTDFEVGADLVSACKEETQSKNCEAKSTITAAIMKSLVFKDPRAMDATVDNAKLTSNKLSLKIIWSTYDKIKYNREATKLSDSCKPKLQVVVYDSNPAPHGNTGNDASYKNGNIRSVLATFNTYLTWDTSRNILQDTFDLTSDANEWARMNKRLLFLKNVHRRSMVDGEQAFYEGWNKDNGLSIAITVCMCDSTQAISDRKQGCREYTTEKLTIDQSYWDNLSIEGHWFRI